MILILIDSYYNENNIKNFINNYFDIDKKNIDKINITDINISDYILIKNDKISIINFKIFMKTVNGKKYDYITTYGINRGFELLKHKNIIDVNLDDISSLKTYNLNVKYVTVYKENIDDFNIDDFNYLLIINYVFYFVSSNIYNIMFRNIELKRVTIKEYLRNIKLKQLCY